MFNLFAVSQRSTSGRLISRPCNVQRPLCNLSRKWSWHGLVRGGVLRLLSTNAPKNGPPLGLSWFDQELLFLMKKRNRAWQEFSQMAVPCEPYRALRKLWTDQKLAKPRQFESRASESVAKPKRLLAYFCRRTRSRADIPELELRARSTETDAEKTEVFAPEYSPVYCWTQLPFLPLVYSSLTLSTEGVSVSGIPPIEGTEVVPVSRTTFTLLFWRIWLDSSPRHSLHCSHIQWTQGRCQLSGHQP